MRHPVILTVLVGIAACDPAGPVVQYRPSGTNEATVPDEGTSVVLAVGETAEVAGLIIRFIEVAEDSRCPLGVTCFWEGRGLVVLSAVVAGVEELVSLSTADSGDASRSATVSGYRITLVTLDPEPVSDAPTAPEDYLMTLEVVP